MKAKITEREATEVTLEVTIESDVVDSKLDEIYQKSKQEIDLPGFRKGKVPRSFIEARFGEDVFYDDAKEELIQEYLPQALEEHDINPVSEPETESKKFSKGEDFAFEVSVEVMPEVEIPDYSEIVIEDEGAEAVSEEDVEEKLVELQEENGQLVPKDEGPVESGDYVTVSYGDEGEQQVRVNEDENPELKEFIGAEVGDEIELKSMEEGSGESPVLTIETIKELDLPEIDDEFARDLGYDDLESLRTKVKTELFEDREEEKTERLGEKILEEIIEESGFEPPEKMLKSISESKIEDTISDVGEEKFSELLDEQGKTRDDFEADIQKSAREQIARRVIVQRIAEENDIELTDDEFDEELEEEADRQDVNPIKLKNQLKAQDQMDSYRSALLRRKVYDFLIDSVELTTEEGEDE